MILDGGLIGSVGKDVEEGEFNYPGGLPDHGLMAPASLEALNTLNGQSANYIEDMNAMGLLHAITTIIQRVGRR